MRLPSLPRATLRALLTFCAMTPILALFAQGGPEVLPEDGTDALIKEYGTHRSVLPPLFKGDIAVRTKADEEHYNKAIDFEARWVTYRFTWFDKQNEPGQIDRLFKDFENDLSNLTRNKQDTHYVMQQFGKQVVVHAMEVLQTRRPIARLNAARVLEKIAALGAAPNELVDALTTVVRDPGQNDGVKLYALRGLRDVLAQFPPKSPALSRERQEKAVLTVMEFVERKVAFAPNATREEVEGFRSLRREGFRALSYCRLPSIGDKARPGLVLLRAAVRDGFTPEPRLDEQMEAALGVTRLRPELDPSYQKDYAAYNLALVVVDLGTAYQTRTERKDELRPYKVYACALQDGLESMKAGSKNKEVDDYVRRAGGRVRQGAHQDGDERHGLALRPEPLAGSPPTAEQGTIQGRPRLHCETRRPGG